MKDIVGGALSRDGIYVTVNDLVHCDDDTMKVSCGVSGEIAQIRKTIDPADAKFESVGLTFVCGDNEISLFKEKVISLLKKSEYLEKF